ncbi:sugar ABC transporter ATP-binding protein [uncultured Pseudokineococcus sp.]|uniref:sugar ABC transporter ATP-binding protein n=1 Tax=uncultured Pseudokineococcus sp. TaxID=1642928 RepID=UPI002616A7BB|nr:sugar ABC transporter ATP-binding protein [uncultured Pseudokineococcus sp.]
MSAAAQERRGTRPPGPRAPVRLEGVVKSFGGTRVLHGVDLELVPGTVHGLVGENGAGKSTLMKVLTGLERADAGTVRIGGQAVAIRSPKDALAHGISVISQELATVPARTVLENVYLGSWAARCGVVTRRRDRERFERLCERTGFHVDPDAVVGTLPIASQQQVEILRAVDRGPRVVVMDEPTAVLTESETAALLALTRRIADTGACVVLVSHFLEEVLGACDTVTALRDGRHVMTAPTAEQTPATLVRAMVGREVDVLYPDLPPVADDAPLLLEATGLSRGTAVRGVDITVRAGEVVGIAGLVGSGRSEALRLVFGADRADAGEVRVAGREIRMGSPREAMRAGLAMVPESRKDQGLLLSQTARDNVTIASPERTSVLGLRRPARERRLADESVERLDVRAASADGPVWTLSGGNQQKVLFAKWLARRPAVLLVDEPTRGVDVSAKVRIHRLIADVAASGTGVLLVSSEVEEVLGLSHRVLVMRQGRITAELTAAEADHERVLNAAFADREELR